MLNNQRKHMVICDCKPIEEMTPKERDEHFKSFSGLTYAEWCEKYKNDTIEAIDKDLDKLLEKLII